jgi:hypothetical protein
MQPTEALPVRMREGLRAGSSVGVSPDVDRSVCVAVPDMQVATA